ncbi:MAG: hypothetical protein K6B74_02330 [Ruminococcus sp.]|nr:hypothetical protein [Ruminococcus sp.]
MPRKKNKRPKYRLGSALIISLIAVIVTFFAYMLNTTLEDVLARERGEGVIITHTESERG